MLLSRACAMAEEPGLARLAGGPDALALDAARDLGAQGGGAELPEAVADADADDDVGLSGSGGRVRSLISLNMVLTSSRDR